MQPPSLDVYNNYVIVQYAQGARGDAMNGHDVILPMWARLEVYYYRLRRAPPVLDHDKAMQLMAETLNGVEDEFSGDPYNPSEPGNDGRMYPPDPRLPARRASAPVYTANAGTSLTLRTTA